MLVKGISDDKCEEKFFSPGNDYVELIRKVSVWVQRPRVLLCETPYTGSNPTSFSLPRCDGRTVEDALN